MLSAAKLWYALLRMPALPLDFVCGSAGDRVIDRGNGFPVEC